MTTRRNTFFVMAILAILFGTVTRTFAHPGHGGHELADGLAHPFSGLDHLLAMVTVGLLAIRMGGKALWIMPCAFMGSMLIGGLLAEAGLRLPGVEYGIIASVLVLGLTVAATSVIPIKYGAILVALFAACHGHAHVTEMAGHSMAAYAVGFLLATAVLHVGGILAGLALGRLLHPRTVRIAGGAISVCGLLIVCGVI